MQEQRWSGDDIVVDDCSIDDDDDDDYNINMDDRLWQIDANW